MIQDVDESLRALVQREALNGSRVELTFEAPTKDWAAKRNQPTVDLYLYDIREDLDRRQVGRNPVRDDKGAVSAHQRPLRYFRLAYLVTAWTQRPEDEHRLLAALMGAFLRYDQLPRDIAAGIFTDESLPLLIDVAQPPTEDRSLSDVWTALGGELKPSLDVIVIAPFDSAIARKAGPLVLEETRLSVVGPGGREGVRGGKRGKAGAAEGKVVQEETVYGGPTPGKGVKKDGDKVSQAGRTVTIRGIEPP